MSKRDQHVVPHDGGWAVRGAGSQRASSIHSTQGEAIAAGRDIARNQHSELSCMAETAAFASAIPSGTIRSPRKG